MPDVVLGARDLLVQKDVAGRCEVVGGNFFDSVPYGGDLYILKFILHDWGDEQATAILRSCRQQIRPDGKLRLIERGIVSAGNDPDPVKFMDLHMMVLLGGQERTESEFRSLLTDAGFELVRVIPTQSPVNVLLEARPV